MKYHVKLLYFRIFFASMMILSFFLRNFISVHAEQESALLLIEANTGCILSQEYAEEQRQVGSLAKLMTAFLTAKSIEDGNFTLDTTVTAGESVSGMQGAVIWLKPGDAITIRELLLALIVGNANDAAAVLADRISGSAENFVMDMNAMAFDLGMRATHFTSPQGFDDEMAYSTAQDMGLLACAVLHCEVLTECLTTWRTFIRNDTVELVNENTIARTWDNYRGLKAGHSPASGNSVIAAAEQDGMICVAVVLGCPDEDERFTLAKKLLNAGFQKYQITIPGFAEEFLQPLKIKGGTESAVLLELSALPALAVPVGTQLQAVMVLPEYMQAPVQKKQKLGTVYFYHDETLLCECALLASEEVPAMTFQLAYRRVLHFLFS
ncbi:MAG: D-alanyl-D-alanine carboxypeptidase [Oscillospiraceae bacterium]|nr:D-alanyl-D-alanine carboxypeptidase [Oscillospiraceae bacterium]